MTLQRLAKNQFRRFSVDDSLDLVAGFPKTRDELFPYKGIILGAWRRATSRAISSG